MTIAQVQYVLEVARCLNISRAAERLYISQSALSQQILRLERELGYPLFKRNVHGLQLTESGEGFCKEAQHVAEAWENLCEHAYAYKLLKQRTLRIVMGPRVYSNGLFQDIMRFFDSHEDINVSFLTEAGRNYLADLRNGTIDLALDLLPAEQFAEEHAELYSCTLVRERQCVLMSPDDPRANYPGLSFQDLKGSTMISGLENSAEDKILRDTCKKIPLI